VRQADKYEVIINRKGDNMNIFVGNLAKGVSEDDLRGTFEAFGQVESVNILKDRFSGQSKGFGFLKMPSEKDAQAAIKETNGKDLKGQAIRVDEANPRPVRSHQSRGGDRRRSGPRRGGSGGGRGGGRGSSRGY
jgi:RNA recognition motif-containing protein